MKIVYRNFIYEAVSVTDTPAFKAWFGNSKVVDDEGDPLNVYHGTTGNFEVFDIKKTYKDSYVGRGFYFTSNPHDADKNYAGLGPDAQRKVDEVVEEWGNIEDFEDLMIPVVLRFEIDNYEIDTMGQNEGRQCSFYTTQKIPPEDLEVFYNGVWSWLDEANLDPNLAVDPDGYLQDSVYTPRSL